MDNNGSSCSNSSSGTASSNRSIPAGSGSSQQSTSGARYYRSGYGITTVPYKLAAPAQYSTYTSAYSLNDPGLYQHPRSSSSAPRPSTNVVKNEPSDIAQSSLRNTNDIPQSVRPQSTGSLEAAVKLMRSSSNVPARQANSPQVGSLWHDPPLNSQTPPCPPFQSTKLIKLLPNILCRPASSCTIEQRKVVPRSSSQLNFNRETSTSSAPRPSLIRQSQVGPGAQNETQTNPATVNASSPKKPSNSNIQNPSNNLNSDITVVPHASQASAQQQETNPKFRPCNIKVTPKRKNVSTSNDNPTVRIDTVTNEARQGISNTQLVIKATGKGDTDIAGASTNGSPKKGPVEESQPHKTCDSHDDDGRQKATTHESSSIKTKIIKSQKNCNMNKPFIWDEYLKATASVAAPAECFKQNPGDLTCKFDIGMKLETRDSRNISAWCLATIIRREGIRIQLRLDGSGNSNDFWQLIDSADNRPVGTIAEGENNRLAPPVGFTTCCSSYAKWVAKRIVKPGIVLAPDECFIPEPECPKSNMFKKGMKLEAVDRKHSYLICPATVGDVKGDEISIVFDGWKGSFDYKCPYYSRDIFPVGWCHRTGHTLQRPGNWPSLLGDLLMSDETGEEDSDESDDSSIRRYLDECTRKRKISFQEPIEEFEPTFSKRINPVHDWILSSEMEKKVPQRGSNNNRTGSQTPVSAVQNSEIKRKRGRPKTKSLLKKDKCKRVKQVTNSDDVEVFKTSAVEHESSDAVSIEWRKATEDVVSSKTAEHEDEQQEKKDITLMSVDDVVKYILKKDDILAKHVNAFMENEIDGKSFMLLTQDCMSKDLGLKLGPILKIKHLQKELGDKYN